MENHFKKHLDRIRTAKQEADQMLELLSPGHNAAEAVLGIAWELLFDLVCQHDSIELSELNTLSAVIHKLISGNTQLKSLELKMREDTRKEIEFQNKKREIEKTLSEIQSKNNGITQDTLQKIESQLKLL